MNLTKQLHLYDNMPKFSSCDWKVIALSEFISLTQYYNPIKYHRQGNKLCLDLHVPLMHGNIDN